MGWAPRPRGKERAERAVGAGGEPPGPAISAAHSESQGASWLDPAKQQRWLRAQLGEAERRGDPTSWGQSETQERRPLAKPTEARARRRAEAEQGARRTSRRGGPGWRRRARLAPLLRPRSGFLDPQLSAPSIFPLPPFLSSSTHAGFGHRFRMNRYL